MNNLLNVVEFHGAISRAFPARMVEVNLNTVGLGAPGLRVTLDGVHNVELRMGTLAGATARGAARAYAVQLRYLLQKHGTLREGEGDENHV